MFSSKQSEIKKAIIMKTIFIYIALLFCLQSYAQHNIVAAEYFLGNDPGVGQGTPIEITAGATIETSIEIPVDDLPPGIHKMYIRVKNSNNKWSHYVKKNISVIDDSTYNLEAAEYFFDEDPGLGNGTSIPLTEASTIDTELEIPVTDLEPGPHQLYIRVKNSNDMWSHYLKKPIMVMMINDHEIVEAEYFFDIDPGVGNAFPVDLEDAANFDQPISLTVPDTLSFGVHNFFLRVKNSNEKWSLYARSAINVAYGVGIEELSFQTKVYPNPVADFLNITIENAQIESVRIIDFNGKCLLVEENPSEKLNLNFLASGVYLLQIETDKGKISEKLVKL